MSSVRPPATFTGCTHVRHLTLQMAVCPPLRVGSWGLNSSRFTSPGGKGQVMVLPVPPARAGSSVPGTVCRDSGVTGPGVQAWPSGLHGRAAPYRSTAAVYLTRLCLDWTGAIQTCRKTNGETGRPFPVTHKWPANTGRASTPGQQEVRTEGLAPLVGNRQGRAQTGAALPGGESCGQ